MSAFWIFMMVVDLLIPLVMIGYGRYFIKKAPKTINHICGYRTSRSMKNMQTWQFAHHYFGRISWIAGAILLPVSIAPMLLVLNRDDDIVGGMGSIICFVQLVALLITIIPTERALKNEFDEDGKRRT